MKRIGLLLAVLAVALGAAAAGGLKVPKVGKPAPRFSLVDSDGKVRSLAGEKGKFVVLEWTDHTCPYVGKHYDSGNMQRLQRTYTAKGVTWFSILSSAEDTAEQAGKDVERLKASPTAVLLDKDGGLARRYGVANTPTLYVVDPKGVLIYGGAIDDIRSTDIEDVARAKNYVAKALDEAMAGKPVATAVTKPYGCPLGHE
jgi:peroxiredoxin